MGSECKRMISAGNLPSGEPCQKPHAYGYLRSGQGDDRREDIGRNQGQNDRGYRLVRNKDGAPKTASVQIAICGR